MIINGREYAFKAMVKRLSWEVTPGYFFNQKEVTEYINNLFINAGKDIQVVWPVTVLDEDVVEVPSEEELK